MFESLIQPKSIPEVLVQIPPVLS